MVAQNNKDKIIKELHFLFKQNPMALYSVSSLAYLFDIKEHLVRKYLQEMEYKGLITRLIIIKPKSKRLTKNVGKRSRGVFYNYKNH